MFNPLLPTSKTESVLSSSLPWPTVHSSRGLPDMLKETGTIPVFLCCTDFHNHHHGAIPCELHLETLHVGPGKRDIDRCRPPSIVTFNVQYLGLSDDLILLCKFNK